MYYEETTERIKEATIMESTLNGYMIPASARRVMKARLSNQLSAMNQTFEATQVERASFSKKPNRASDLRVSF